MPRPVDKNFGKHPHDPEYDDEFDYEDEFYRYELELESREEERRIEAHINNNHL